MGLRVVIYITPAVQHGGLAEYWRKWRSSNVVMSRIHLHYSHSFLLHFGMLSSLSLPARCVQDEEGLQCGLDERGERGEEGDEVVLQLEEGADDAEGGVDEHAGLGHHEQQGVQVQLARSVEPQAANLERTRTF